MNANVPLLLLLGASVLSGCVSEPLAPAPPPPPPAVPDTNVYFYPMQGRSISPSQQDRDKYECNAWAVKQTDFDPSEPQVPPQQRVRIVAGGPAPGAQVAAGALTGAAVGAVVSSPWHTGRGALLGGLAGAAIGGIAQSERTQEIERQEAQATARASQAQTTKLEGEAAAFRRALGACLEARGYSVK